MDGAEVQVPGLGVESLQEDERVLVEGLHLRRVSVSLRVLDRQRVEAEGLDQHPCLVIGRLVEQIDPQDGGLVALPAVERLRAAGDQLSP